MATVRDRGDSESAFSERVSGDDNTSRSKSRSVSSDRSYSTGISRRESEELVQRISSFSSMASSLTEQASTMRREADAKAMHLRDLKKRRSEEELQKSAENIWAQRDHSRSAENLGRQTRSLDDVGGRETNELAPSSGDLLASRGTAKPLREYSKDDRQAVSLDDADKQNQQTRSLEEVYGFSTRRSTSRTERGEKTMRRRRTGEGGETTRSAMSKSGSIKSTRRKKKSQKKRSSSKENDVAFSGTVPVALVPGFKPQNEVYESPLRQGAEERAIAVDHAGAAAAWEKIEVVRPLPALPSGEENGWLASGSNYRPQPSPSLEMGNGHLLVPAGLGVGGKSSPGASPQRSPNRSPFGSARSPFGSARSPFGSARTSSRSKGRARVSLSGRLRNMMTPLSSRRSRAAGAGSSRASAMPHLPLSDSDKQLLGGIDWDNLDTHARYKNLVTAESQLKQMLADLEDKNIVLLKNRWLREDATRLIVKHFEEVDATTIDLSYNFLGTSGGINLLHGIEEHCNNLVTLNVQHNQLGPSFGERVFLTLTHHPCLKTLNVGGNHLKPEGAVPVGKFIRQNTTVNVLNLSYNWLGQPGVKSIAKALGKNTTITDIDLSDNRLGELGAADISNAIRRSKSLVRVSLADNYLLATGGCEIAKALKGNNSVTFLNLANNRIGAAGVRALSNALKRNKKLADLDLSNNRLLYYGTAAVADMLDENHTLTRLSLYDNRITDLAGSVLAKALAINTALTSLDIACNDCREETEQDIINALKSNPARLKNKSKFTFRVQRTESQADVLHV